MTAQQVTYVSDTDSKSVFRDTAFMANRDAPIHRLVPWIAGFSSQFVEDALGRHLDGVGTVLDPFAGVGTTLVEADRAGHRAVGFEINPYAAFASRMKLGAHRLDACALAGALDAFMTFMKSAEGRRQAAPKSSPPEAFRTRSQFYSPKVLRKVLFVRDFISTLRQDARDAFRLAFASSMVSYSNYSYEPSLGRRSAAGKAPIDDFPVAETVREKMGQIIDDAGWYGMTRSGPKPRKDGTVLEASFLNEHWRVKPQSVDLIVTSPPYLNNYHYNRNTRPHLYWLGFCEESAQMRRLEDLNFGKYWQNARGMARVDLDPAIHDAEMRETVDMIRSRNVDRKAYGGEGWANYAALYFNDSVRFVKGAKECMRSGATALVVIGNSILQGVNVPTDRFIASIAEEQGLDVVNIHALRAERVGSSIVGSAVRAGKTAGKARLYESVVEVRRP